MVMKAAAFPIVFLIAGHFMGHNTMLDVLLREGYEVESGPAGRTINKKPSCAPVLVGEQLGEMGGYLQGCLGARVG